VSLPSRLRPTKPAGLARFGSIPAIRPLWNRPAAHLCGQMLWFAWQQAVSCLFPLLLFSTFAVTQRFAVPGLPRYDLILLLCLGTQYVLYRTGWETKDELKVIAVFHLAGLCLELFKTHWHSWAYPEPGWTKIAGVPLYSGFMYAAVASYLCQAWRRLEVRLLGWPKSWAAWLLVGGIYGNFFAEHWLPDARWLLAALILLAFWRTAVTFVVRTETYTMPMALAFVLIGFFLWIAENIATFYGAWQYPNQQGGWHLVHFAKISSWSLLVIFSFLIVAQLKHVKETHVKETQAERGNGC
jgi:uncharacterized membrane protein YoaT (DUF817 family)